MQWRCGSSSQSVSHLLRNFLSGQISNDDNNKFVGKFPIDKVCISNRSPPSPSKIVLFMQINCGSGEQEICLGEKVTEDKDSDDDDDDEANYKSIYPRLVGNMNIKYHFVFPVVSFVCFHV
jgi:hypothetical protein